MQLFVFLIIITLIYFIKPLKIKKETNFFINCTSDLMDTVYFAINLKPNV